VASQIFEDLMRFKPDQLTPNAWAVKAGVSRTVWADMRRHGNPSRRTLEKLLAAADSSLAEFEALRLGDLPKRIEQGSGLRDPGSGAWASAARATLPLIVSRHAADWHGLEISAIDAGQILDQLPRPTALAGDPDSYAVTIVGDSMWPRFRPGRRVAVSPRSPVAVGDDVLVILRTDSDVGKLGLIKELVRRTTGFVELRQFNPDANAQVPDDQIESIHKVVGELF
jgi:SOS-response transcriptional repressor LexA